MPVDKRDFYLPGEAQEYCLTETFRPTCLKNEAIVMTSAIYGRMRIGRCLANEGRDVLDIIRSNSRYVGCSVDVLHIMDRRCSGKQQCEVRPIDDQDLQKEQPCPEGWKNVIYLEAKYRCISGM